MSAQSVMIVAGEASGDMHGANLVLAMQKMRPGLSFCGMGAVELRQAGVEILFDASSLAVVGLIEVLGHFTEIRKAMRVLEHRLRQQPPDLLILLDYPDFNLILARKAKSLGIPVFYYISPQVWAWRSGRVKKIKRLVDRMAVILPFEADFYRRLGMKVDFVGHPLLDHVVCHLPVGQFRKKHGIPFDYTVIGILPGSRKKEISAMLPIFLRTAQLLAKALPKVVFLLPLASTLTAADLEPYILHGQGLDLRVISQERYELMAACDAVMAASGTVTLELAILGVPMVVSYRISLLTYLLGRFFIKIKYASLVNLVAGREVVPELIQNEATPEKINRAVRQLLDKNRSLQMQEQLRQVVDKLGRPGASQQAAAIALDLLHVTAGSGLVACK